VRGSKALSRVLDVPVLAVIPYMEDSREDSAKSRQRQMIAWLVVLAAVAALGVGLVLVHFFFMPLDILWLRVLRLLQRYIPASASLSTSPLALIGVVWSA